MHIIKNSIWYGSWVLIGITIGLILYPSISHGATIYDNISGGLSGGTLTAQDFYTDQAYFNTTDYFRPFIINATSSSYSISSIVLAVAPYNAVVGGNSITIRIYDLGTATSTLVGTTLTDYYESTNAITISTSTTVYSTSTWNFSNAVIEAGRYYGLSFYDQTETDISTNNRINVRRYSPASYETGFFLSVGDNGDYIGVYDDLNDVYTYNSSIYADRILIQVYGAAYAGASTSSGNYITSVYPVDGTYSVATTSYINFNVLIPSSKYEQNSWKAKLACAEFTEQSYFSSLLDWGFSYTVDLVDDDCDSGQECTPHGVSYPEDGELEADSVYNCTASLLESRWFWFDKTIESQRFTFYTFDSTSSDQFAELIARAEEYSGTLNTTGTSTSPLFGDCSILNGQISDCVIEPVKFLIIPSQTDRDNIKSAIDSSVFDNFPFSYIGMFNEDMASTSYFATTSAEFPDFTFSTQNMNGVTTTITIFDGSQFVSAWSSVEEFDTLRTAIQYALIIMFTTILYFRVRRLIPTGDNVKGV